MTFLSSKQTPVKHIMTKKLSTICAGSSVFDAAEQMRNLNLGFLPVSDGAGRVIGTVTDRDLAIRALPRNLAPRDLPIESVMSTNPVCCKPDATLAAAIKLMEEKHVRRIVVTDDDHRPVGVLSTADLALKQIKSVLPLTSGLAKKVRQEQEACWQ